MSAAATCNRIHAFGVERVENTSFDVGVELAALLADTSRSYLVFGSRFEMSTTALPAPPGYIVTFATAPDAPPPDFLHSAIMDVARALSTVTVAALLLAVRAAK